jgi:hypothetical protein
MSSRTEQLRMEILLDGLVDAVGLPRIHSQVESLNPGASASELQSQTIEAIRSLAEDGLVDTGYPNADGEFVTESLAESLQQIQDNYIAHYDENIRWFGVVWVNLTEKGRDFVLATEKGRRIDQYEQERIARNKATERRRKASEN